eukprot:m.50247 g.50247  ORF g.50247 m.50247 type:complete len:114 (-) comp6211_c1_seq2:533-874(-)
MVDMHARKTGFPAGYTLRSHSRDSRVMSSSTYHATASPSRPLSLQERKARIKALETFTQKYEQDTRERNTRWKEEQRDLVNSVLKRTAELRAMVGISTRPRSEQELIQLVEDS